MRIAALYAYPVKACAAVALEEASLDAHGLTLDRRYAFLDSAGKALTQRSHPMLRAIRPALGSRNLHLDLGGLATVAIPLQAFSARGVAEVWGRRIGARLAPAALLEPVSAFLGAAATLAALHPGSDSAFVDAEPVLVTSTASLAALEQDASAMERFRPNIVVEGAASLEELGWGELRAGETVLQCVRACERCEVIGEALLRRVHARLAGRFGVYCRVARAGRLARGEPLSAVPGPR